MDDRGRPEAGQAGRYGQTRIDRSPDLSKHMPGTGPVHRGVLSERSPSEAHLRESGHGEGGGPTHRPEYSAGFGRQQRPPPQERESYLAAVSMLKPFGLPLVGAVEELVECRRLLGDVPLLTAARGLRGFDSSIKERGAKRNLDY